MVDRGCSLTHASEKPEGLGRVCREGVGKVALLLSESWSTPYRDDKIAHEQKVGSLPQSKLHSLLHAL